MAACALARLRFRGQRAAGDRVYFPAAIHGARDDGGGDHLVTAVAPATGELFLSVRGIVIHLYCEESHEFPVTVRCGPPCLCDTKRVDSVDAFGRSHAVDLLPFEAGIAVNLRPGHLSQFP